MREPFWPVLDSRSAEEQKTHTHDRQTNFQRIRELTWPSGAPVSLFLDEARRLYEEEEGRRKVADSKATTYLLSIVALAPILMYFDRAIWSGKLSLAPPWLALLILAAAIAYTVGSILWVLRAMELVSYSRLGAAEMVKLSRKRKYHTEELIRIYLENASQNSGANNERLTKLRMAHAFLVRTFFALLVLVFLETICGVYKSIPGGAIATTDDPPRLVTRDEKRTAADKAVSQGNVISSRISPLRPSAELTGAIKAGVEAPFNAAKEAPPQIREKGNLPRANGARCGY